ncbi:helix-turn-helix transcriptional regulator [Heyndrickxia sp. FSL W8-0496]|jgi:transcriptional regulator with XRE-family HTH domain|uniref:helix-turn-helix transcriptional regulator n=1 Tax=Heyndrickxia TaxID=2837504 RepID=UPI0030F71237
MIICFLGAWIKQSKYSRPEICKMFGISQNTLSNWCTGKTYPSIPQLLKLCKLLNVKVEDLYKLREEENN